jgi:ligand-binding SRPBCC domain-containing protein
VKIREFQSDIWLPRSPEEVFPFFSEAANLDAITPAWLEFRVVTPSPVTIRPGALIDYRLRVRGLPIRWRTRINVWEPPTRFVDEQLRGPYRLWVHEHTFLPRDGGTLVRDHVRYAVPLDFLLHRIVRADVEKIFRFRAKALQERFGKPPEN